MKTLVTGACGFIGSHLSEALVAVGHDVTAMAIYSARDTFGWLDECEGMRKVRGDVRDAEQMRRLVQSHDIVFHLAALGSVPYSYEAPRSVFETNAIGTLNVLEACREAGAKLVHTSTSEVYGTALYTPQDINHPLQAQSPYAASKIAADKLVEAYTATFDMDTVTLRPFNTYGPRQSERAVIARIMRQALDPDCERIEIGDIRPKRDFTYVDDTVRAFLAAMNLQGCYNAGSGRSITIEELAQQIRQLSGLGTLPTRLPKVLVSTADHSRPDKSEVWELCADAEPLRRCTGWEPSVSLTEGLQRTMAWRCQRPFLPDLDMVA